MIKKERLDNGTLTKHVNVLKAVHITVDEDAVVTNFIGGTTEGSETNLLAEYSIKKDV